MMSNTNMDNAIYHTTYEDYGKGWLVNDEKSFEELGKDEVKLEYLEKCYKSMRRREQMDKELTVNTNNEKYKYDKNAIISKPFPFKASEFKYPNDGQEKPKSGEIIISGGMRINYLEQDPKFDETKSLIDIIMEKSKDSAVEGCLIWIKRRR